MGKSNNVLDNFLNVAGRIGSQRHLAAIRDSFATLMPLLIAGSIGTIINNIPINGWRDFLSKIGLSFLITTNGNIWWGTFSMITLLIVFVLAYNLAKHFESDRLAAAVVALSTYLCIVPQSTEDMGGWGYIALRYANATSLLVGILIAICASEIFCRLYKVKSLLIKMPEGVPPAVARAFASVIPGAATVYIITIAAVLIEMIFKNNIFTIIVNSITRPLSGVADTLPSALVIVFVNHFLWIFGLHGANILDGIIQTIYVPLIEINAAAFNAGQAVPHIVTKQFIDAFAYMGGSGATLGLLISIFIVSKSKSLRTNAKLSIGPGVFNINEPVIFGLPIVLNPVFAIPFILAPMVCTIVAYGAMYIGIVQRTVVVTHWAMPPILSGILATGGDIKGALLQIVNIALSVLIYLPFTMVADKQELKKEAKLAAGK